MLSKFIYKALMVFALAFFAQVGYSQSYVSTDVAVDRLEAAIQDLQSDLNTDNSVLGANPSSSSSMDFSVMTKFKNVLLEGNTNVSKVIETAETEAAKSPTVEGKTARLNAIDKVKTLLLN